PSVWAFARVFGVPSEPKLRRSLAIYPYHAKHKNSPAPSSMAETPWARPATGSHSTKYRRSPERSRADRPPAAGPIAAAVASSGRSTPTLHRSGHLCNAVHCDDTGYERPWSTAWCPPSNLRKSEGITGLPRPLTFFGQALRMRSALVVEPEMHHVAV